jgi:hypothetical protein
MKSAVFQEYIIRIKISKVIFFLIFDIITLESWEGVRIEKKRKKNAQELTLADCAPYGFLH